MSALIDNLPYLLKGFGTTLLFSAISAVIALVLGTILAAFRVSPVPSLRAVGTTYVNIFRNTPLVLLLVLFVFGMPQVLQAKSDISNALVIAALSCYTAAFVCEALRAGINSVHSGQAEAARSIGLTFTQTLSLVVLPQAFRASIPPLTSVIIALVKNSAIAEAFGVTEAAYRMDSLIRDHPSSLWWIFAGTALGYLIIVFAISGLSRLAEPRKVATR